MRAAGNAGPIRSTAYEDPKRRAKLAEEAVFEALVELSVSSADIPGTLKAIRVPGETSCFQRGEPGAERIFVGEDLAPWGSGPAEGRSAAEEFGPRGGVVDDEAWKNFVGQHVLRQAGLALLSDATVSPKGRCSPELFAALESMRIERRMAIMLSFDFDWRDFYPKSQAESLPPSLRPAFHWLREGCFCESGASEAIDEALAAFHDDVAAADGPEEVVELAAFWERELFPKLFPEQARPPEESKEESKQGEGHPSEGKPGEGKPGEGKPGEGKPGEGKPGEGKPGEGKPGEGQPSEGKPGEGQPSEGQPSEGKPGEGKPGEGKPGEGKPGEGKPGEGQPGEGQPGEGKPGEGQSGEGKPGEGQSGEGKPGEGQPGEGQPGESQPGEGQPGEGQPGEGQPGEGKPGEGQPGEGQPGEGKPGEGQPGEGQPGEGQPGEGQPGEGQPESIGKTQSKASSRSSAGAPQAVEEPKTDRLGLSDSAKERSGSADLAAQAAESMEKSREQARLVKDSRKPGLTGRQARSALEAADQAGKEVKAPSLKEVSDELRKRGFGKSEGVDLEDKKVREANGEWDVSPSGDETLAGSTNFFDLGLFQRRGLSERDQKEAAAVAAALAKMLAGKSRTVLGESPSKKVSTRHLAQGRLLYARKEDVSRGKMFLDMVVDCSGSMNGKPVDAARVLVSALSLLAQKGVVEGRVIFSSGEGWMACPLPLKPESIGGMRAFSGSEGIKRALYDNARKLRLADAVFVYTDAQITDAAFRKDELLLRKVEPIGLYVGSTSAQNAMQKYFDHFLIRDCVKELAAAMVARFLSRKKEVAKTAQEKSRLRAGAGGRR